MERKNSIGILGGGQLAKMICISAYQMGLRPYVLSPSLSDPAAQICKDHQVGDPHNTLTVKAWLKDKTVATVESEFYDLESIKSKKLHPNPTALSLIRDRLSQKQIFKNYRLPTAMFSLGSATSPQFTKPMVFKKRLFGYDGYGTAIIKNQKELSSFMAKENLEDWIVEDFVKFKRELAFSVVRGLDGSFCALPLVESFQKNSKCLWVKGPVSHSKLLPLQRKVKKALEALDYVGVFSVELFETTEEELLINEVAPRVHNSAHYSIEALPHSQFDLHLMSLLGQKLPRFNTPYNAFAMHNLIGSTNKTPKVTPFLDEACLHWYGKTKNRKGRKMGHITSLRDTPEKALKKAIQATKKQVL